MMRCWVSWSQWTHAQRNGGEFVILADWQREHSVCLGLLRVEQQVFCVKSSTGVRTWLVVELPGRSMATENEPDHAGRMAKWRMGIPLARQNRALNVDKLS